MGGKIMIKGCISIIVFFIMLTLFFLVSATCYVAGAKFGKQYIPDIVCQYVGL